MKKLLIILSFLFLSNLLFAQDYILKRNGEEVYGTIKEISPTEIKYNDTINTDLLRVVSKSEVFMIRFKNGTKEVYEQTQAPVPVQANKDQMPGPILDLGSNDYSINGKVYHFRYVKELLLSLNDDHVYHLLLQAKALGVFGNILAYSSIPIGYLGFALAVDGTGSGYSGETIIGGIMGALCLSSNAANIVFKVQKKHKIAEAIDIYNKKMEMQSSNQ